MSAWFVLSSMGFYPVTPGIPQYAIGTCLFDEVQIHLENGKTFYIKTQRQKPTDFYVASVSLSNNQFQSKLNSLHHADIMRGGVFQMNMSSDTSKLSFGKSVSRTAPNNLVPESPLIDAPMIFKSTSAVKISTTQVMDKIFYSVNGAPYKLYEKYFSIDSTSTIKAFVVRGTDTSSSSVGTFYKMKHPDWKIKYNCKYNKQYTGGGDEALIDGITGNENWRRGFWQGFQGQDFEVIIDLGELKDVKGVNTTFLQDSRSWIIFPSKIEYTFSVDGNTFVSKKEVFSTVQPNDNSVKVLGYPFSNTNYKARYVKIKATNFGKLPDWHQGKGGDAFIFVDEIDIK
jgi:hypothetical protein